MRQIEIDYRIYEKLKQEIIELKSKLIEIDKLSVGDTIGIYLNGCTNIDYIKITEIDKENLKCTGKSDMLDDEEVTIFLFECNWCRVDFFNIEREINK